MKHIKSIHVVGLICIADLIFASHGFFCLVIIVGYGVYRLEKCEDCPEPEKLPDPRPVPKGNLNELTDLAPEIKTDNI